jgi:hypothetical protein
MPTVAGDVVLTHGKRSIRQFTLWRVSADGAQSVNPSTEVQWIGGQRAIKLAFQMAHDVRGASVFLLDTDRNAWARLWP